MDFERWKKQLIDYLQEKIRNNQINYDEFKKAVGEYRNLAFDLEKILEFAAKNSQGKDKDNLWKLYENFTKDNAGEITERLRNIGYGLRNNEKVYERFYDKQNKKPQGRVFRIMQLTRLGKRGDVFFTLLNEFQGENFPKELADAFNPVYQDEIFKVFIYSFLSGILGETKGGGEE